MITSINETDKWVKETVCQFILEEGDWLYCSFRKVKFVSDKRRSTSVYGFEWLIQTAFSYYLLRRTDVSELKINQESSNGKKYDIDLKVSLQRIIIEIKTIAPCGISYVERDVNKDFPSDCRPYFLVFSYPTDSDEVPTYEGITNICADTIQYGFIYYLYKKTE